MNGSKRKGMITFTEFESYFDYFGSVANSEDSELLRCLGPAHSRAFFELYKSVMEARRQALQEGAVLEPALQIEQLIEAVRSDS